MEPIWSPSPERIADANVTRFISCVNARRSLHLQGYDELYQWSIDHPADFWFELARFADMRANWGDGQVIANADRMPGARFFPTALSRPASRDRLS
jgi:acetoacetyl-CoA synthetase